MPPLLRLADEIAGALGFVVALVVIAYCWGV